MYNKFKSKVNYFKSNVKLHYKISKISGTCNNFKENVINYFNNNGYGLINQLNGSVYIGQLKNGLYDGKGIMTLYDGMMYKGHFERGKFHGYGTIKFTNGNIYKGYFVDNLRQGYGILIDKNNRLIFDGLWYNNSTQSGHIYYSHKLIYIGDINRGLPNGYGKIYYSNGTIYEGHFLNGKPKIN